MLRKMLIAAASVIALIPSLAHAVPALAVIGAAATAAIASIGASAIATAALNIAIAVGLSLVAGLLAPGPKRPKQPDIKREISEPTSRPPKRFVYGHALITGTPAPWRVSGVYLYGCLILNSRPSAGTNFKLFFDKREATLVLGDLFDFSGPGAQFEAANDSDEFPGPGARPRAWLGLGDQTGPPDDILADLPDDLLATDGWRGLTVLWVELHAGVSHLRPTRWPRTPPEIEVEADWSLVYDPREASHDPDDASTWAYSNNQALCLLDAILNNPIRKYSRDQVLIDTFSDAADLADESVSLFYAGGTEPRYTANGMLVWTAGREIMDQVKPLADAGAGDLVRIGGRLAYSDGAARTSVYTVTDVLGDEISFERLRPGKDLPNGVKTSYVNPGRFWEESELPALSIDAGSALIGDEGLAEIQLDLVTSPTQAMRIQKITRNRLAAQKRLAVVLPPDAINVVPGNVITCAIPSLPRLNGVWRVEKAAPAIWLSDDIDGGVAMRVPVSLVEEPDDIDAWAPATDEFELSDEGFATSAPTLPVPANLTLSTGPDEAEGTQAYIRLDFDPLDEALVDYYEWQWRQTGGDYQAGGDIDSAVLDTATSTVFDRLMAVAGISYDIRVRAVGTTSTAGGSAQRFSEWAEETGFTAVGPDIDIDPPTNGQATGGWREISVSFKSPNQATFEAVEFYGSDTNSLGAATLLDTMFGAANSTISYTETGLATNKTRYYFARSRATDGAAFSTYTASVTATTDPLEYSSEYSTEYG